MSDTVMRQKVKNAFREPRAPEALIRSTVLRAKAVTAGRQAQEQLKTAPPESCRELIAQSLIGQLALQTELPGDSQPRQLARQLLHSPAFARAMQGGDLLQRLSSGALLRQLTKPAADPEPPQRQPAGPEEQGPVL